MPLQTTNGFAAWIRSTSKTKKWSIDKARKRKEKFTFLTEQINKCMSRIAIKDEAAALECKKYEAEIERLMVLKTQGAVFRSKAKYTQEYEKNSKFFFSLEKNNYGKKTMSKIETDQGQIIRDPRLILKEQHKFYSDLYTSDPNIHFTLKNDDPDTQLSQEDRERLDQPISIRELNEAMKSFKPNKTPGNTGLTAEFFQFFWAKLVHVYLDVINLAKKRGHLHASARRGIIALIPKKGRNPNKLAQWRPLTMLNLSYKILAKVLALRMKSVYPDLISNAQAGFMEGRQISSTIRTVIDISIL